MVTNNTVLYGNTYYTLFAILYENNIVDMLIQIYSIFIN